MVGYYILTNRFALAISLFISYQQHTLAAPPFLAVHKSLVFFEIAVHVTQHILPYVIKHAPHGLYLTIFYSCFLLCCFISLAALCYKTCLYLTKFKIMAKLTAQEFQEKHNRRLKAAVDDMRKGVQAVTESPTAKAAKKGDKMREGIVKAIDSGKWAAGLNRVSLDEWKQKMLNKGVNRVAAGIDEAADKVQAFAAELLPHIDAGVSKIGKLPDVTLEDSINRMTTFVRHMADFKRK